MGTQRAVYIASGHSYEDPGASGNGIVESKLNVAIVTQLVARLRQLGITTYTDLDVGNPRASGGVADSRKHKDVALYVEFHHNAAQASARGYEIWKTGEGLSARLGRWLHDEHVNLLRRWDSAMKDRGVKDVAEPSGKRARGIVTGAQGAAVLVEMLFVSNAADAALAKRADYARSVAEVTARGIVEFGFHEKLWTARYAKAPSGEAPKPPKTIWVVYDGAGRYYGQRPTQEQALPLVKACLDDNRFKDGALIRSEPITP